MVMRKETFTFVYLFEETLLKITTENLNLIIIEHKDRILFFNRDKNQQLNNFILFYRQVSRL
jgi:hypothetical protein